MGFRRLDAGDFEVGGTYKIGNLQYELSRKWDFYFKSPIRGDNRGVYINSGLSRREVDDFIGYYTLGDSPEVRNLDDVARLYNFLNEKWWELNGQKIDLPDGDNFVFPYEVQSQEDWNSLWPKLKKAGFTWSDGEDLNEIFSECHDFPEKISVTETDKLKINIQE
jgi:hypothetical protein